MEWRFVTVVKWVLGLVVAGVLFWVDKRWVSGGTFGQVALGLCALAVIWRHGWRGRL